MMSKLKEKYQMGEDGKTFSDFMFHMLDTNRKQRHTIDQLLGHELLEKHVEKYTAADGTTKFSLNKEESHDERNTYNNQFGEIEEEASSYQEFVDGDHFVDKDGKQYYVDGKTGVKYEINQNVQMPEQGAV
eukprot:Selendium_serpulae@DN9383_c0_g1_i1.p1